jgi:hypothetical protein
MMNGRGKAFSPFIIHHSSFIIFLLEDSEENSYNRSKRVVGEEFFDPLGLLCLSRRFVVRQIPEQADGYV